MLWMLLQLQVYLLKLKWCVQVSSETNIIYTCPRVHNKCKCEHSSIDYNRLISMPFIFNNISKESYNNIHIWTSHFPYNSHASIQFFDFRMFNSFPSIFIRLIHYIYKYIQGRRNTYSLLFLSFLSIFFSFNY